MSVPVSACLHECACVGYVCAHARGRLALCARTRVRACARVCVCVCSGEIILPTLLGTQIPHAPPNTVHGCTCAAAKPRTRAKPARTVRAQRRYILGAIRLRQIRVRAAECGAQPPGMNSTTCHVQCVRTHTQTHMHTGTVPLGFHRVP